MPASRVAFGEGAAWIVRGWNLFLKAPWIWILLVLIYFAILLVLTLIPIPIVGGIAQALIGPALTGGMLYGAAQLERGETLQISYLFRAFQDQSRLTPMLALGGILLAGSLVMPLITVGFLLVFDAPGGGEGLGEEAEQGAPLRAVEALGLPGLCALLLVGLFLTMAMFYAIPLSMLGGVAPIQAVKASIAGCLANILPLTVFGLIYLVLAVLASIPFALGFLVLGPVTIGAMYSSYRDVFVDQSMWPSQAVPPSLPGG
jgi:Predicted integral membrane protein